jgi:hypothetical protein
MAYFDAENKQATHIASQYVSRMELVKENGATSTAELREFITKVQKHEGRLAEIAKTACQRLLYLDGVQQNLAGLAAAEKRAEGYSEAEAAKVFAKKDWGQLLDYHSFNPSHPAKPQLVKAVKDAIERETSRGKSILAAQIKSAEEWKKAADKHVAACEKARTALVGTDLDA